jgi:hypothetical protein
MKLEYIKRVTETGSKTIKALVWNSCVNRVTSNPSAQHHDIAGLIKVDNLL